VKRTREYDGIRALLEAFPSHGFVIDLPEARSIFYRVDSIAPPLVEVIQMLGVEAMIPYDREAGKNVVKYLNPEGPKDVVKANRPPGRSRIGKSEGVAAANTRPPQRRPDRASGNTKASNGAATRK
jgi:hypothetical protein